MLFDLRGRGRRRTIQAIYLSLAILMGGGLILFGIGGGTNGGILDYFRDNKSSSTTSGFEKQLKAAQKRVTVNPKDAPGWAALARLHAQIAGSGENYDQNQGAFTEKARPELTRAASAWKHYLALDPKKPDPNVATVMVKVLEGLNQLPDAVAAEEIVVESQPANANLYYQLAVLAYAAGQTRKGDLSADKAVSLAPKDQRADYKQQLDAAKTQAQGTSVGSGTATVTTGG
jgi:protein involved in temperature-dependent protein secretion